MAYKAEIANPCSENWDKMNLGLISRFCDKCEKSVVDFSKMDRPEILEYLLSNQNGSVCGRIYASQLDFSHSDILVTIKALSRDKKNSNLAFYLLALSSLAMISCNSQVNSKDTVQPIVSIDTSQKVSDKDNEEEFSVNGDDFEDIIVMGEVSAFPDSSCDHNGDHPYTMVNVMPEFVGGIDSLYSFFDANLEYPEWEKSEKIQGTVYVSFVVTKTGKITDAKILRSVTDAKSFDKEVLRVVHSMPNWIPGEQDGNKVDVAFVLPVKFRL